MSTTTQLNVKLYGANSTPPNNQNTTKDSQTASTPSTSSPTTNTSNLVEANNTSETSNTASSANTGFYTTKEARPVTNQPFITSQIASIIFSACLIFILAFISLKIFKKSNKNSYCLKKRQTTKLRSILSVVALFSFLFGLASTGFALIFENEMEITAAEKITIDANILGTDEIAVVHSTITTKNAADLKLYITSSSNGLTDVADENNFIPSIAKQGPLTDNSFGVYIGKAAPTKDSNFYPVYQDTSTIYSPLTISNTESADEEQVIDIWYGIRSKSASTSVYSTDLNIKILGNIDVNMQNFTQETCSKLEMGVMDLYKFEDTRDGKIYSVAKMQDGNCWMTENLDLALGPDIILTSANSDFPEGYEWSSEIATSNNPNEEWDYTKDKTGGNDYVEGKEYCFNTPNGCSDRSYSFDPGPDTNGVGSSYNIFSATAGTSKAIFDDSGNELYDPFEKTSFTTPTASICPKGWHMAKTSDFINLRSVYGIEKGTVEIPIDEISSYLDKIPSITNFFPGGYNQLGMLSDIGIDEDFGYYAPDPQPYVPLVAIYQSWPEMIAIMHIKDDGGAIFDFDIITGTPLNMTRFIGSSIRCLANVSSSTIEFDENTDDPSIKNMPHAQSSLVDESTRSASFVLEKQKDINGETIVPTRDDYIFAGWSKSQKRTNPLYFPGDTIESKSSKLTLYATWLKSVPNLSTLQELGNDQSLCNSLTVDTTYGLRDSRDDKVYRVAKLRDGNCWMTENLKLSSGIKLNSNNSNLNRGQTFELPSTSNKIEDWDDYLENYNQPRLYEVDGDYYYNWSAAIAKNDSSNFIEANTRATTSICPNGWHLPSGNEDYNKNEFMGLLSNYGWSVEDRIIDSPFANPLLYSLTGDYDRGKLFDHSSMGHLWSSTIFDQTAASALAISDGAYGFMSHSPRYIGLPIRCILGEASTASTLGSTNLIAESTSPTTNTGYYTTQNANSYHRDNSHTPIQDKNSANGENTSNTSEAIPTKTPKTEKSEPLGVVTKATEKNQSTDPMPIIVITLGTVLTVLGVSSIIILTRQNRG